MHERTKTSDIVALSCGVVIGLITYLFIGTNAVGESGFSSAIRIFGYIPIYALVAVSLSLALLRRKFFQKVQETPSQYSYVFVGKSRLPDVCTRLCEFVVVFLLGWIFSVVTLLFLSTKS